jgi:hypothetical protein
MWNIDLIQIQQYYEKQSILTEGHIKEGVKKVNMVVDVLSIQE